MSGSISDDKTRLDFVIPKKQKALLERYCTVVGRTKTDVLRELIQTLERKLEIEVIPDEWTRMTTNLAEDLLYTYYRQQDVSLYFGSEGCALRVNGERLGFIYCLNRMEATKRALTMVDSHLDETN